MITGLNATEGVRRTYLAMLVVYLAFVIYGSVVPLEFRRVPVSGIWSEFSWGSPPTEQRISRSDFATNVLLFVPVTFLAMGVVTRRNARWVSRTVTVAVVCSAWGLSLIVESAQVFIPPRVASVSDIVAQWIGAGLGLLAWYAMGDRVTRWARGLWTDPAQHRLAVKILWVYALGFVFHQLLPLDLSLRPCDLYSKLTADRVNFCPFADVRYSSLYTIVMKTTMMMPVGLLLTLLTSRRRAVVWVVAVQGLGFAAAVEMLQVFTFSRYASSTDVVFGTLGAIAR